MLVWRQAAHQRNSQATLVHGRRITMENQAEDYTRLILITLRFALYVLSVLLAVSKVVLFNL